MDKTKTLTLTRLEADNFKRLKVVRMELKPGGGVVQLRGKNANGKSSALDAIHCLVGGARALPPEPIRKGATRARIRAELAPDGLVVERVITPKGTHVEVRSADGAKYGTPQAILDGLMGPQLRFDPGIFITMEPAKQIEVLRSAAKLDFAALDAKRSGLYDERTRVNNEGKATRARHDAIKVVPDAKRVDVAEVLERQKELLSAKDARAAATARSDAADEALVRANDAAALALKDVEAARAALKRADEKADAAKRSAAKASEQYRAAIEALEQLPDVQHDLDAVAAQLASAEAANKAVDAAEAKAALAKELEALREKSAKLTEQIEVVDKEKADLLAAAKLPIDGLGFTESGVTLDGVPFEQASQAQKIIAAFALWLAEHPKLGVVPVPNASHLDSDALELVARMADEHGVQVLLEVVGDGDVGIVFEDGEVVKVDGKPVASGEAAKE